jgi:hypothetical protein
MIQRILRYLYPPRKLHRIPRTISAEYKRQAIRPDAQLIMMAGLARDPHDGRRVFNELADQHGEKVFDHIYFEIRRQRSSTARERWMRLLRQIMGENEPVAVTRRIKRDPKVIVRLRSGD